MDAGGTRKNIPRNQRKRPENEGKQPFIHAAPDVRARKLDDLELPDAVETSLKLGAKVIWLPTNTAENHYRKNGKDPSKGVVVTRDGKAVPELQDIFALVKQYNAVLSTDSGQTVTPYWYESYTTYYEKTERDPVLWDAASHLPVFCRHRAHLCILRHHFYLITSYVLPIMGGGAGAGAVPMAQVYSDATGQDPAGYLSFCMAILGLGNIIAILMAVWNSCKKIKGWKSGHSQSVRFSGIACFCRL